MSERRLSDVVSVGVLTRTFPPALIDEVIAGLGRTEQRQRSLPARAMAYFSMGMALHSEGSYEDVLGLVADGLAWSTGEEPPVLPGKSAIFQARARLGAEPVKALFERVVRPLADPDAPGAWLAGRRMVAIDGTCLDVADTVANDAWFGRAGVNEGERAGFPQARLVAVAECGSHALLDAAVGPHTTSEHELADELIGRLSASMVLCADRGFSGFASWSRAVATGADLVWRSTPTMEPHHLETLEDGSWLAELRPSGDAGPETGPLTIRVIDAGADAEVDDGRSSEHGHAGDGRAGEDGRAREDGRASHDGRAGDDAHRLFTTMLDPHDASAFELATAYGQRWRIESIFEQLAVHRSGPRTVLRSKSPELVLQEIWGQLCCHVAIRSLMWEAATGSNPSAHPPPPPDAPN